jgi:1-acyl-sn-glycerol-3-phosphate acyltransferase
MLVRGFARYLDRLARGTFAAVRWRAGCDWREWDRRVPTLVIANHTSWWDGFLSHQLAHAMGQRFRILMEAEHLARYRVFQRFGALPVERRSPPQAMRDLALAAECLAAGDTVWIYPQGSRRPAMEPLDHLEHGAAWLVARVGSPVRVVPVAFRYPFLSEQRPEAFALVGEPWLLEGTIPPRRAVTAQFREMLTSTLATLDADLAVERLGGYELLVRGRLSLNNRLDRWRHALGLLPHYTARNG